MTTVTVADDNGIEFQIDPSVLQSATVTSFNASQVILTFGSETVVLSGSFGGFDGSNLPTTGTLTAIVAGASGQPAELSITDFTMAISAFRSFLTASDGGAGFTAALLAGNDTFNGANDDGDVFDLAQGDDTADGRGGSDTADYSHATSYVIVGLNLTGPQYTYGGGTDNLINIENVTGSAFDDQLVGSTGFNVMSGGAGDDILFPMIGGGVFNGGSGFDTLSFDGATTGGVAVNLSLSVEQNGMAAGPITVTGIEAVVGSSGGDTLLGDSANNTLRGLNGNDNLAGRLGDDILDGGNGFDMALYGNASGAVTIDLRQSVQNTGSDGTDTFISIENVQGSTFNDTLIGSSGANVLVGNLGSDVIYGLGGDDTLRDGGESTNRDFLYGGSGNDTYYVISSYASGIEDLVYEGGTNPDLMAGVGDVDTIHSQGDFFWDYYSVGEVLYIDATAGSPLLVGGKDVLNKTIYGGAGNDRVVTYGHNSVVDLGAGTDAVDFGPYGLDSSYDGHNTLVMRPGTGIDYIYNFHSGVDKVDLTAFHFGITGAQVLAQAVNVDNPGTANDYSYFYLTNAGGIDNFVVFMGLLGSQLQAGDFLT